MKPVQVYSLRTKSLDMSSNKKDEGWKLITRKKKVMRKDSWRAHERAIKILDGKQGAMKQVEKSPKEDGNHGHHRLHLVSLFEFFPKGYFDQINKIVSSFMVTSHQEIAMGELSTQDETDLVVHTVYNECEALHVKEDVKQIQQMSMIKEKPINRDPMAPQIFLYVPKAKRKECELPFVEVLTSKTLELANKKAWDAVDRGLLEKYLPLPLTKQHAVGKPPSDGSVK
ncbi:hypothetical protein ACH5RR_037350 [Cinchona calisaya]|uniref:Uncharacterized protein n=1 Tax=Cinchona calisaya TaxID=153742 RepID=A0ABD2Y857_9GENT